MAFSILYVCTGNICRSPLAERYTVHRLAHQAPDVAHLVRVSSVGIRGLEAHPMDELAAQQLARHGGVSEGFAGRRLAAAHVEAADLILTMTRDHRAAAVVEAPTVLRRTFTLLEAADLVRLLGDVSDVPDGAVGLVAAMAVARSTSRLEDYDVADPIGRSADVHAAVAATITAAVDVVADAFAERLRLGSS